MADELKDGEKIKDEGQNNPAADVEKTSNSASKKEKTATNISTGSQKIAEKAMELAYNSAPDKAKYPKGGAEAGIQGCSEQSIPET